MPVTLEGLGGEGFPLAARYVSARQALVSDLCWNFEASDDLELPPHDDEDGLGDDQPEGIITSEVRPRELGRKIITFAIIRVWGCLAQRCCGSLIGRRR